MRICPICNLETEEGTTCPNDGATLIVKREEEDDDALIGRVLEEAYRIDAWIARGGMGTVYRGTQIRLDRTVAIKILRPELNTTQGMVQRFFLEAKILSQLNHPNIISIFDFGNTADGLFYMVMELVEGRTLQDYAAGEQGLPEKTIMRFMDQICRGLAAAHEVPLVHRDLKPANIFIADIGGEPTVKILDFGISKLLGEGGENLTETGIVMGTPGYMAPEQISQMAEPSTATDIYALGGILYFMMGGRAPFGEFTGRTALARQLEGEPEPIPESCLVDPGLAKLFPIVREAMFKDPKGRYGNALEMLSDLRHRSSTGAFPTEGLPAPTVTRSLEPTVVMNTGEVSGRREPVVPPRAQRRKPLISTLVIVVALVSAGLLVWTLMGEKEPLVFGMSADFSGFNSELGREMQLGIEAAFNEVNLTGGLEGRLLELVALDDGYEPVPARNNMLELIQDRGVFAIIGNVGTPTAQAAVPVALEQKILFFSPFTGAAILRRDPPDRYVFNYRASYAEETAAIVRYFVEDREIDPATIAVFSQDDGYGDDGFQGVRHALHDYDVREEQILHVRYARNTFDLDQAVRQIIEAGDGVKAVVMIASYAQAAGLVRDVRAERPEMLFSGVSFMGARALAEEFAKTEPAMADGVIVTQVVPFFESGATGVLRYREALSAYAPNQQPSFVSLEGYIAAMILIEGLRRADALETESVIDALESIEGLDLGTGSAFSFGPSRHQASNKVWAVVLNEEAALEELVLD